MKYRYEVLTGLRFYAAMMIVLHHILWYFIPSFNIGSYLCLDSAVSLFFVLSGFVLYLNNFDVDIKIFYKKRFFRIYPIFFLSLIAFYVFFASR